MKDIEGKVLEKLIEVLSKSGLSSIPTTSYLLARIRSRQSEFTQIKEGTFTSLTGYASPVCYAQGEEVQVEYLHEDQVMSLIDDWIDQLILRSDKRFSHQNKFILFNQKYYENFKYLSDF
jgi:hypothetical protein